MSESTGDKGPRNSFGFAEQVIVGAVRHCHSDHNAIEVLLLMLLQPGSGE